jgi:hypothetical protein
MPLDYRARDNISGYLQYCVYPGKIYYSRQEKYSRRRRNVTILKDSSHL